MSGIVWLASYPKSGNTWFRIFLANLLRDTDEPASINDLEGSPIASARGLFDENVGIEASDLTAEEIDHLRPELYCHLAETAEKPLYMKIHDAYTEVSSDLPLIPAQATAGVLYLIRNPLDVAISFAHHNGTNYDTTIDLMACNDFSFCGKPDRLSNQLRQKLLSWSGHVLSWIDGAPFPVCLLRFEDMKAEPIETFTSAVRFAGLTHNEKQIQKAIEFSSFEILQQQEEMDDFRERSHRAAHFFRKGKCGSWRAELTSEQAARIIADHGEVMRRFGYLDENGDPLY